MLQTLVRRYDRYVLAWPRLMLSGLLTVLALSLLGLPDFRLDASADSLLLEDGPALKQYRELNLRYGLTDFLFLTVTSTQDILAAAHRRALAALRDELRALPGLAEVVSVLDMLLVDKRPGRLADAVSNYRTLGASDVDLGTARRELLASPIYRNFVVSADGRTTTQPS